MGETLARMKVVINRFQYQDKQVLGQLHVFDGDDKVYECLTLELPWKNNQRRVSCIPLGEYEVIEHTSPKFGKCFWVQDVPGRSEILIHKGNFYTDILGCILPGKKHTDINGDGYRDVTSSSKTMKELLNVLPKKFTLEIV